MTTMSSLDGSITSAPEFQAWDTEKVKELKQLLMCTSLELESARAAAKAQEEIYNGKLKNLEELLSVVQMERDEAYQRTMQLENSWGLPTWETPLPDDEDVDFLLSDPSSCTSMDEYVTVTMQQGQQDHQQQQQNSEEDAEVMTAVLIKSLPERGKLLQAVMQAGPLLQTLMLAGPLPQWHHPPPAMDSSVFVPQGTWFPH